MRIVVVRNLDDVADLPGLVSMVVEQLHFIGYSHTNDEARAVLEHALRPGSRAVLFVGYGSDSHVQVFAFGNICGGLECGGDYFWLNELFVATAFRKTGLGSSMLDFIKGWAKENGCVYLALVTHPGNASALALYRENGMEIEQLQWVDTYL